MDGPLRRDSGKIPMSLRIPCGAIIHIKIPSDVAGIRPTQPIAHICFRRLCQEHRLDIFQIAAAGEHRLIAFFHQLQSGQFRCNFQSGTIHEHIIITLLCKRSGGQDTRNCDQIRATIEQLDIAGRSQPGRRKIRSNGQTLAILKHAMITTVLKFRGRKTGCSSKRSTPGEHRRVAKGSERRCGESRWRNQTCTTGKHIVIAR